MATKSHNNKFLEWSIYLHELETRLFGESQQAAAAAPVLPAVADASQLPADGMDELSLLASRLHDPDPKVRLEIARRLGESGDAAGVKSADAALTATEALVQLLQDESHAVRWAAMNGLIQLEREAVRPLLEALTQDFQSANLRQGAHHVFRALHDQGALNGCETQVFRALEGAAPAVQAAWAANNALIEEKK